MLAPADAPGDTFTLYGPHPSASQTEAFVKGLYQATLQREGSPSEVHAYAALLDSGALSRPQAAQAFVNSPEHRGNQVRSFYHYFLGREPSQAEVDFYVKALQSGVGEAQILANFALSPEHAGLSDDPQFVQTVFVAALGRSASQAEADFYVGALGSGQTTRGQVVANLLHSPEAIDRVVKSDYMAYLGREADDAGLAAWRARVQARATFGSVAVGLLGSQEFFDHAGQNL